MSSAPHVDLPADVFAGLTYREYFGFLALSLAAYGEYSGVTWAELARAVRGRVEDREWHAAGMISGALDELAEGDR